jgi:putative dehydrogenase
MKTAVIGLGSMGFGMAASLIRAGHDVWGHDINPDRIAELVAAGGKGAPGEDDYPQLDAVIVVVLNAAQTQDVLFGDDGLAQKLGQGTVVLSCATVSPDFARAMEQECHKTGLRYLDAPISGGSIRAAAGELTIMASGSPDAFDAAQPALDAMAQSVFRLGEMAGAGSAMKAVNQMLVGIHIAALAEAMTFGITQGVDPDQFMKVISQSAGNSWIVGNRGPHIAQGDYTPRSVVNIWPKDLGIVLDIAKGANYSAPLTATALQQFIAAAGQGLGWQDDAAVAKVYARNAGVTLPGDDT